MAMSPIRPELGRQDWSAIARGGQAFGQGVGQGLAQLGAGIGKAMDERKAMKAEVKATKDLLSNPVMQQFAGTMGISPEQLEDMKTRFEDGSLSEQAAVARSVNETLGRVMQIGGQVMTQTASGGAPAPSAVREYEYYSGLSPDQQEVFLNVKRSTPSAKPITVAGGKALLSPDGTVTYLSTGEEEAVAAAVKEAEVTEAGKRASLAVEREEQEAGKKELLRQTIQDVDIMTSKIDEALELSTGWTTGAKGFPLSFVPGTPAYRLKQDSIATIKNKLSAKALADMRSASPTGGGVGQVTEREWERLGTLVASLDIGIGEEALDKNLNEIKTIYQKWGDAMQTAHAEDMERDVQSPPTPQKQPEVENQLPSFLTLEDAEAANLPVGSRVMVDGVEYEVQ